MFFGIGVSAMTASILCDEIFRYYRNKQLLEYSERSLDKLRDLNLDYDILLQQLKDDPDFTKRIAPAILGTPPSDEKAIHPKATIEQLLAAREALKQAPEQQIPKSPIPAWLIRCMKPVRRIILFIAGASLILISFVCFGKSKKTTTSI